jgi:hypothetical protein
MVGEAYTQEIQVVIKLTYVGHPCKPCFTPLSGRTSDNTCARTFPRHPGTHLAQPIGRLTAIVSSRTTLGKILSSTWVIG